jgi:hypothetical protein
MRSHSLGAPSAWPEWIAGDGLGATEAVRCRFGGGEGFQSIAPLLSALPSNQTAEADRAGRRKRKIQKPFIDFRLHNTRF